jgi:hypothetical protein
MQECVAKRARIEQPVFDRLDEVINIALLHRLASDLDPVSILCISRTCRMFLKKARQIASQRLRSARLSITPLVDGMEQHGESKMDGYDSETFEISGDDFEQYVWSYEKRNKIDLVFAEQDDEKNGLFCPNDQDTSSSTFNWKSNSLSSKTWQEDDYNRMACEDDYVGQHFKLYWHPDPQDAVEVPKRYHMTYDHQLSSMGVFVGKVDLGIHPPRRSHTKGIGGEMWTLERRDCLH